MNEKLTYIILSYFLFFFFKLKKKTYINKIKTKKINSIIYTYIYNDLYINLYTKKKKLFFIYLFIFNLFFHSNFVLITRKKKKKE